MVEERRRSNKEKVEEKGGKRRRTEESKDVEVLNEFGQDANEEGYFQDVVPSGSSSSADVDKIEVLDLVASWINAIEFEAVNQQTQEHLFKGKGEAWDDVN
eukprot:779685-Karenia_brevis.AAC.1